MTTKKKDNLRHGFKKEANDYAREFRKDLNLLPHEPLCPWSLAKHLAIPITPLSKLENSIAETHYNYLTKINNSFFSAVTIFHRYKRLIIYNDSHNILRQASNIAHEISHGILGHRPSEVFNKIGCRHFDPIMEAEANWLAPALLVSEEAALHIVKNNMSVEQASQHYKVSKEVVRMRINVTGAKRRINQPKRWGTF